MVSEKLHEMLNKQINWELYSAYFYLSMAAYCESINLPGIANWFRVQDQEERFHAMKLFDFLIARGLRVTLLPIEKPPGEWESPLKAFEDTYAHEQKVTGLINNLMSQAVTDKDYATVSFLQWYVDEQVEEEEHASALVEKLRMIEREKGTGLLYMLDKELSTRIFTPPAQTTN